jgi:sec-independent protein translocase protein TatA
MLENLFVPSHLAVTMVIVILFFGGKKIPELGKGIGQGFRAFRDGIKGVSEEAEPGDRAS